jgi:phenylpropionate dioxygenase-like ring-hydroxylating dioxygenase large terminal subunit
MNKKFEERVSIMARNGDTWTEPAVMDGGSSEVLRGDVISGDRYWSREFMQKEWDHMWTRVWHIGARVAELMESGDYVVHNFMQESVLIVRQDDDSIRAFYNVCPHRGNRLVWGDVGGMQSFSCAYHGWAFGKNGQLQHAPDPENFRHGTPCGKVSLVELKCEVWGGFVWYNMDPGARPLLQYLDPLPQHFANRELDKMKRIVWRKIGVNCNWKFASDNFNESYHVRIVHPTMGVYVVEDYSGHSFEMYANGHNRALELGQPSSRFVTQNDYWENLLKAWELDPAEYAGRAADARLALQAQKRKLGEARGHEYMAKLTDDELTDFFHYTAFPNLTITGTPMDGAVHIFRTEPHPTDPEKCTFEYWGLYPEIKGAETIATVSGPRPWEEAEPEILTYGIDEVGDFIDEDLSVAVNQQKGLHSRGYRDAMLAEQEARVRRFHEVLNDYIADRR